MNKTPKKFARTFVRTFTFMLGVALVFHMTSLANTAGAADTVTLVTDGKAVGAIYVSSPVDEPLTGKRNEIIVQPLDQAAQELQAHILRMSGVTLPIHQLDGATKITGPAIVLGSEAVRLGAAPTKTVISREAFRVVVKNNLILIGGQSDRGTLLGSYFLLRQLGCDWVMPGDIGIIAPQKTTIAVPAMDDSQAPDFLMRRLWYRGFRPRVKADYERMAVWLDRQMASEYDEPANGAAGHYWSALVKRHKDLFDADPTMLALVRKPDGSLERSGPQIETTHPKVIALIAQNIKDTYQKNIEAGTWTAQTRQAFPIGPADGLGYSLSSESLAIGSGRIDPIVGEVDRTDEMVLLANTILEDVNKTYPNAMVGFYSYSTHADYPARYKPNPNVVQIFAPINFSRFHSVLDSISKTQPYYKSVVEQWSKLAKEQGNPLIYRGYNWNLAENMLPYSKLEIWGKEIPWYHQQNFLGFNIEATKSWSILGASDYVLMRLAWDTSSDWRKLLTEYCAKAYGPGGPAIERYLLRLTQTQHDAGQEAGSYHAFHLMYDQKFVAAANADIQEALKLTQDPRDIQRIAMVAHNIKALELYLAYHSATMHFDFPKAKQGYDAMLAHWQTAFDENADTVSSEVPQYLKRFMSKFVEQGLHYSSGEYTMVYPIPDALPTVFDPITVGHSLNYHSPDIVDTDFIKTKTFSTTWDAQGLAGMRDGAVWYRVHFELPANAKGKPVGLFLGGVEDEARVWVNGKTIGTSGRGFSTPFLFDLTDAIHYDKPNLIAIQVVRNSKANEIGLGGIIRPSFVFTGPQLEQKSPKPLELRRVLPGGELGEVE